MSFFKGIQNKVSGTLHQAHSGVNQNDQQQDDRSLTTLLDRQQRAEISILISQITETMRNEVIKCFDETPPPKLTPRPDIDKKQEEPDEAVDLSKLSISDTGVSDGEIEPPPLPSPADREADAIAKRRDQERALALEQTPETKALRTAVLSFFDAWAESVILRVGEVVNSRSSEQDDHHSHQASAQTQQTTPSPPPSLLPSSHQRNVTSHLQTLYPPISTALTSLPHPTRTAILNAILLLLLSLESYRAHSRTLLVRLTTSLNLPISELSSMEKDTAIALLKIADVQHGSSSTLDASASTRRAQSSSSVARKWKVGVAAVGGAALIGITGGLAAPLLAAGVGTLMGGLGLGATAAAGYLGALAGNAALVGGLFGAYGARMTGGMMDKFAREIEDFAFLPITPEEAERQKHVADLSNNNGSSTENKNEHEKQLLNKTDANPVPQPVDSQRLRLTIAISGWLTSPTQLITPWLPLSPSPNDPNSSTAFATPLSLRWELSALLTLGTALQTLIVSQAWSTLRKELIKRTVLAAIYSALLAPLAVRKVLKFVDSPFGIAKLRAMKAGEVLADALIERVQGERPVNLIGTSLGARVIYSCLLSLSRRHAFGLVENVVLMGAAIPSDAEPWRAMRSVVSGRLVNVYDTQDYILAVLYRTSSAQMGVAGIQGVEGVVGVENYDASDVVGGHLKWNARTGRVLEMVHWDDLDLEGVRMQESEEREKERNEKDVDEGGGEEEAKSEGIRVEDKGQTKR